MSLLTLNCEWEGTMYLYASEQRTTLMAKKIQQDWAGQT